MKHITWLAVLFTTASAAWSFGCGCSTECLQPVRERVILQPVAERTLVTTTTCAAPARPACVTDRQTVYAPECPNCRWVPPDKNNAAYMIGNVLTAPFRAITGRELGQPDVVATHQISEPLARKVYTEKTRTSCHINKCGQPYMKKVTIMKEAGLEPVGERLTTVKVIRLKPMPIAESCLPAPACPAVAERIVSEPLCPAPIAERVIIRSQPLPVAERTVILRSNSCSSCPSYNYPSCSSCPSSGFSCPSGSCNSCW